MKEANKVDFNVVLWCWLALSRPHHKIWRLSAKVEWPMGTLDCQHEQSFSKNWMPQKPMVYLFSDWKGYPSFLWTILVGVVCAKIDDVYTEFLMLKHSIFPTLGG